MISPAHSIPYISMYECILRLFNDSEEKALSTFLANCHLGESQLLVSCRALVLQVLEINSSNSLPLYLSISVVHITRHIVAHHGLLQGTHSQTRIGLCARDCARVMVGMLLTYLMYGNTSAGVGVGGVLLCSFFYMCPTVECILCSESV